MGFLILLLSIFVQATAAIALARTCGFAPGLAIYAILISVCMGIAGRMLQISTMGSVNWTNYVAGFLLPWSQIVGGGQLLALLIKNAIASMMFGLLIAVGDQHNLLGMLATSKTSTTGERTNWLTFAIGLLTVGCWIVLLAAWLTMLRSFVKHQSNLLTVLFSNRGIWMPILLPPIALVISVVLKVSGHAWYALLIVGIPLLILLLPVILMFSVILYHYLIGKPIRWN